MGQVFTRIFSLTAGTAREQPVTRTHGTQTDTKFTERLTNFDTVEISSTETFDHGCNICDMYTEKEAVGYCCVCKQYLCYNCCKHHGKISVCENHTIVGKEEFEFNNAVNSLFDIHIVPMMQTKLPQCIDLQCNRSSQLCLHNAVLLASFSLKDPKNAYFLIYSNLNSRENKVSRSSIQLRKIKKDAEHMIIESVTEDNIKENKICQYFNPKKSKHVWGLKFSNDTVHFQQVFSVTGKCYGLVPFDNGLAISLYIPTGFSVPDWQVQYVDFTGDIKRQIYYDSDGKPLFKNAGHIASNCTEDILFVSDNSANTVIALDTKGNVIYKFTHDSMKYPQDITCDEENNVYVACYNKVIQIHALGKKSRIILSKTSQQHTSASTHMYIVNLYYYKENRRLAVIDDSKNVTIFTFPPK